MFLQYSALPLFTSVYSQSPLRQFLGLATCGSYRQYNQSIAKIVSSRPLPVGPRRGLGRILLMHVGWELGGCGFQVGFAVGLFGLRGAKGGGHERDCIPIPIPSESV